VAVDILLPADVKDASECIIERWLHKPGDRVRAHEPLLEVNTDKAVVEVACPADGVLQEILKPANEVVQFGEVLGRIEAAGAASKPSATPAGAAPAGRRQPAGSTASSGKEQLSPAVRQLLRQHNLDPAQIAGSGRGGRITVDDVQKYLDARPAPERQVPAGTGRAASTSRKIPHSPTRRRIAQHMVESVKTSPHVTAVFDADLSAIVAHREQNLEDFEKRGAKLTYTAYFVAAAVQALKAVPEVNARWHDDGLEIYEHCNIGVAAAVPGGLIVPVLSHAEEMDLFQIAKQLQDLTAQARAGKLELHKLQGGTFTITNHGTSGSLMATPIIFQPQVAILGIGKMEKQVVVVETPGGDALQIKPMAYVTLTIDHRALDGFTANAFLTKFVEALTSWS
jgi:2-oxoglutarate dehydrogenase E2 component (dihydrolipoamide succinyltransferase)